MPQRGPQERRRLLMGRQRLRRQLQRYSVSALRRRMICEWFCAPQKRVSMIVCKSFAVAVPALKQMKAKVPTTSRYVSRDQRGRREKRGRTEDGLAAVDFAQRSKDDRAQNEAAEKERAAQRKRKPLRLSADKDRQRTSRASRPRSTRQTLLRPPVPLSRRSSWQRSSTSSSCRAKRRGSTAGGTSSSWGLRGRPSSRT